MTGDARLLERWGYVFQDSERLTQALTHRSYGARNNERLEFLGDAVVNLVMADALYGRFPDLTEGELTRLRARLVRTETLASVAREIGLGGFLRLGGGELKSGGFDRDSILADALEAVVGAVYQDGGFEVARAILLDLFAQRLSGIEAHAHVKDAKTALQEFLQARGSERPRYELVGVTGQDHEQHFEVVCLVSGQSPAHGRGATRRHAEQEAARLALKWLGGP
ncbi:ribonuclease III [Acidiferrobacter sp.]|uniref:ribonuclease III n=1 Tax=Acidiferrobacter sp. TaxID=1872107 RepID=UPI002608821F|nr:ribonuclease III [Acidiferrobacter sp.]